MLKFFHTLKIQIYFLYAFPIPLFTHIAKCSPTQLCRREALGIFGRKKSDCMMSDRSRVSVPFFGFFQSQYVLSECSLSLQKNYAKMCQLNKRLTRDDNNNSMHIPCYLNKKLSTEMHKSPSMEFSAKGKGPNVKCNYIIFSQFGSVFFQFKN